MMTNAHGTWCLLTAATLLSAGCSVLIDSDRKFCSKDSQCVEPYICETSLGICQLQAGCQENGDCRGGVCVKALDAETGTCEPAQCELSKECEQNQLCNTEDGACVSSSQATCKTSDDCKNYEGAKVCISSDLCRDAECEIAEDCSKMSPTALCNAGACEDPTWACLGVPDPRETANSSKEASFKVKVLFGIAQDGAKETGVKDLTWRVCQFGDPNCANEVTNDGDVTYSFGGEENYLVVKGLESGLNYKIQLQGFHPTTGVPLYPTEYLMYRTVVGDTEDPKPILMYDEGILNATGVAAEVKRDPDLGLLLMRIFDCTDVEVAGVQVSTDKMTVGCGVDACPTTVFYQNTSNAPDTGATVTNTAGRAGILNLKPSVNNRITLTRAADGKQLTSFVITPRPRWLTYVFFWPWDYGTAAN